MIKRTALPSVEFLNECFHYDKRTGDLIWKTRPLHHFKSAGTREMMNARCAGKRAGAVAKHGYIVVVFAGKHWLAHRIIYKMLHGSCPDYIDHIDGDPTNNRIENLREVTNAQNTQKKKLRKVGSSKYRGVYRCCGKWQAQIKVEQKPIYLGAFADQKSAALAYDEAALKHHGVFARPNFPNREEAPHD